MECMKRAARRMSLLIKNSLQTTINDWEEIDEDIVKVNLKLYGHNVNTITANSPPYDEKVALKKISLENILINMDRYREMVLLGDLNTSTRQLINS